MRKLVWDIETDGLLRDVTVVHCINLIDRSTGRHYAFNGGVYKDGSPAPRDGTIEDGLRMLEEADELQGQNIIGFDIPALKKLYPWFNPRGRIFDSKVLSQVIWPHIAELDIAAIAKGTLPHEFQKRGLIGRHSLEAWGMRLGVLKGDFKPSQFIDETTGKPHTWKSIGFTREMDEYGRQDPVTTLALVEKIESKMYSQECIELETRVAQIIFKQHERGFAFDMKQAEKLTHELQRRHAELAEQVSKAFAPWYAPEITNGSAVFTPRADNKRLGYTKGAQMSKVKRVVFNPDSRDHIANRLQKLHGWKPTAFTDEGKPKVDESVLEALPWPEAKALAEYLMIAKRLGQVATGNEAWIKRATRGGIYGTDEGDTYRIHGEVTTNGAVTGRMTHSRPNVAQVPKVGVPYGVECRSCFVATPGYVLVGCDAEGLELRMLAHFMARYDGGAYAETVVNGKKEDGTDVHTVNQKAIGLNKRDSAKTFIYALIYGAGDYKLGEITYDDFTDEQRARFLEKHKTKRARTAAIKKIGATRRDRMMTNLPALAKLVAAVKATVKKRGYLIGLDGRHLHVRSQHSALNTLLQSGGAIVMKRALVLLDDEINAPTSPYKGNTFYVANIHDEFQIETREELAHGLGLLAADCIRRAGEHFKLRCPLAGSYAVGRNWAETH